MASTDLARYGWKRSDVTVTPPQQNRSEDRNWEDQPRDDKGQWMSGGGSESSDGTKVEGSPGAVAAAEQGKDRLAGGNSEAIDKVIKGAEAGGASINPLTGAEPTGGYMVSMDPAAGASAITPDASFWQDPYGHVEAYLQNNAATFTGETVMSQTGAETTNVPYIGVWHDAANGETVLDPSMNVSDRSQAVSLGQTNNQQSIWDVAKGEEIPTGGTGGREATHSGYQTAEADQPDDQGGERPVRPRSSPPDRGQGQGQLGQVIPLPAHRHRAHIEADEGAISSVVDDAFSGRRLPLPAHRVVTKVGEEKPPGPPHYGPGEVCAICTHFVNGVCAEWEWEVDPLGWCDTFKLTDAMKREFERQEKAERAGEQGPVETTESEDS